MKNFKNYILLISFSVIVLNTLAQEELTPCTRLDFETGKSTNLYFTSSTSNENNRLTTIYIIYPTRRLNESLYTVQLIFYPQTNAITIDLIDEKLSKTAHHEIAVKCALPSVINNFSYSCDTNISLEQDYDILFTIPEDTSEIILNQFLTIDGSARFTLTKLRNSYRNIHLKNAKIYWERLADSLGREKNITDLKRQMHAYKDSIIRYILVNEEKISRDSMIAAGDLAEKIRINIDSAFAGGLKRKIDSVFLHAPVKSSFNENSFYFTSVFNQSYKATYDFHFSHDGRFSFCTLKSSEGSSYFLPEINKEFSNLICPVASRNFTYDFSEFDKKFKSQVEYINAPELTRVFNDIRDSLSHYKSRSIRLATISENYPLAFQTKITITKWRKKGDYYKDKLTGKPAPEELKALLLKKNFYNPERKKYPLLIIQVYFKKDNNPILQDIRLNEIAEGLDY